jgi:hypothetical protein
MPHCSGDSDRTAGNQQSAQFSVSGELEGLGNELQGRFSELARTSLMGALGGNYESPTILLPSSARRLR